MPRSTPTHRPILLPLALLSAAAGQFFLSQAGKAWTLFPGILLFGAAIALLYPFFPGSPEGKGGKAPPFQPEWILFTFILALAFQLRLIDIDSLPAGMHTDQGLTGLCALRILHEGWRPFGEVFDYEVPEVLLFYQLAGWFGLAGSSYFTFHLFFILLSLSAFPLVYWAIRQWAGPRTALLSLFILAVMRWNWIETRNGYPSIQVPFYLFGALAFWTCWRKNGKNGALFVSALFVGAGFYTYQAFKIVPLLMAVVAHFDYWKDKSTPHSPRPLRERVRVRGVFKVSLKPYILYFLAVLILISPLLAVMIQRGNIGHREADLFIGTKIIREGSLQPLWDVWSGTLLMFNRAGDPNPRHNIPGHRMLDDVTAVFFVLGLALAWKRRKEPGFFYPLAGFGVMLLTGLLSTDPAHSNRLVSLTPFVAAFAGSALVFVWDRLRPFFRNPAVPAALGVFLLAAMTVQNALTYFWTQAADPQCQEAFGPEQTGIGRLLEGMRKNGPGDRRFYIEPFYFRNHTVAFLSYPARDRTFEFNLQDWVKGLIPRDKPAVLFLEKDDAGVLGLLENLCPGITVTPFKDPQRRTLFDTIQADPAQLGAIQPWPRGLKGTYLASSDWKARPVTVQWDPVLNFASKYDFPFTQFPPFRVRWTGGLEIPRTGEYQFQVLTTDNAQLELDGKHVTLEKPLRLTEGAHALRLDFEKDGGDALALHLIWKEPGISPWEVVPATVFGYRSPRL